MLHSSCASPPLIAPSEHAVTGGAVDEEQGSAHEQSRALGAILIATTPDTVPFAVYGSCVRASRTDSPLRGVDVLVVDDEPDATEVLQALLQSRGARVRAASSAAEAFALIESAPPTILVSDIGMPVEDGYSLIRKVRTLGPLAGGAIPAIALTAFTESHDRRNALSAGFDMHLPKPLAVDALTDAIAELCGATTR